MTKTIESAPTQDPVIANASVTAREAAKQNIVIRGARQHNLKDVDLDLPRNSLIVFTGPSEPVGLCPAVLGADGQAGGGPHHGPRTGDCDRTEDDRE